MSHLCCRDCRIRIVRRSAPGELPCPQCGLALQALPADAAMGYALWTPLPMDIDTLTQAMSAVLETPTPYSG